MIKSRNPLILLFKKFFSEDIETLLKIKVSYHLCIDDKRCYRKIDYGSQLTTVSILYHLMAFYTIQHLKDALFYRTRVALYI